MAESTSGEQGAGPEQLFDFGKMLKLFRQYMMSRPIPPCSEFDAVIAICACHVASRNRAPFVVPDFPTAAPFIEVYA
jgi:hypothetical protein